MSLSVICQILGLFVDSLTSDDKYSLLNRDNWTQPIQMQLSLKQTFFWQCFSAILKLRSKFEHVLKRDDPNSLCIFEITDSERRG